MAGTLYLIPSPISQENIAWVLPAAVQQCVAGLSHFIVEHPKTARQFLKQIGSKHAHCRHCRCKYSMSIRPVGRSTGTLLQPLLAGHDVGLLSEAGCPAVADPGAELVRLAHKNNIAG
jgi:16S rRNA (cytidine1402-2'-O)-methyltransferase